MLRCLAAAGRGSITEVSHRFRDRYAYAIETARSKFHGNAEEREGKLHWKGTVATEAERNEIFELNKDQLSDPDTIKPGQVLRLP